MLCNEFVNESMTESCLAGKQKKIAFGRSCQLLLLSVGLLLIRLLRAALKEGFSEGHITFMLSLPVLFIFFIFFLEVRVPILFGRTWGEVDGLLPTGYIYQTE